MVQYILHLPMENQKQFRNSLGLMFSPEEVIESIVRFMKIDEGRQYKITIGSDSLKISAGAADFVTAIVCHRVGNGGIYFWRRLQAEQCRTLRERIWQEVLLSLDIAKDIVERMKQQTVPLFDFEVHIDVGEGGPTRDLIQELVGVVRANNFEARVKPESYAASSIADRYVK